MIVASATTTTALKMRADNCKYEPLEMLKLYSSSASARLSWSGRIRRGSRCDGLAVPRLWAHVALMACTDPGVDRHHYPTLRDDMLFTGGALGGWGRQTPPPTHTHPGL
jgi:hypothetical protein